MAEEHEVPILSRLRPPKGAVSAKKRLGRGTGGGFGKTAGKGQKGQKARQPGNIHKLGFEGGQTPLQRRLPKHGFVNVFRKVVENVNVGSLAAFDANSTVTVELLVERGLVRKVHDTVKVLGDGEIDRALTVRAHAFSKGAKEKIERAGGKAETIE
jgi:large subunit ribosomal protein L15